MLIVCILLNWSDVEVGEKSKPGTLLEIFSFTQYLGSIFLFTVLVRNVAAMFFFFFPPDCLKQVSEDDKNGTANNPTRKEKQKKDGLLRYLFLVDIYKLR